MMVRFFIVFMLIHKVFPQVTVEGVVGGSAVLPCSASESKTENINVYWRHNESMHVYDIINGKSSLETQERQYRNRSATFPDEYFKGNFSLKLTNLQNSDAGEYYCFITEEGTILKVELLIKERSAEDAKRNPQEEKNNHKEDKSNHEEDKINHEEDKINHGAQTGPEIIVTISLILISILLCICVVA